MKKKAILAILLCILLTLAACDFQTNQTQNTPLQTDGLEVFYLDVGQADSAVLICGDDVMMIDGGNRGDSDYVYSWLQKNGIDEIDVMVCTHAHEDHVGGLPGALNYAHARTAYAPVTNADTKVFQNFLKYLNEQNCPLTVPKPGDSFLLGEAEVEILGPVENYNETNNTSIVLKVTYGSTSFLFTGDMEQGAEADLLLSGADVSATVLKLGHHGSRTSTSDDFLWAVSPEYGVISVGEGNDYGHPNQETLDKLARSGVTYYRTDFNGIVHCTSDGRTVTFETEKGGAQKPEQTAQTEQTYIGNSSTKKFHRETCGSLPQEKNRVYFDSRQEALDAGYSACSQCKP